MKKSTNLYIFIILLFALALRLIYFFGILEGDDVEYVDRAYYISQNGLAGLKELDELPGSNRPGQYLPTALIFRLFGVSELSTALFPLLASLITCYLIYRIGRLLISEEAGLLSALLWAVFPLNIFLATQLDPEGPLTMATTGAMYSLMISTTKKKPLERIGCYFLGLLLIGWAYLIKQSALPIVFAAAAWFYWSYARTAEMRSQLATRFSKKTLTLVIGTGIVLSLAFLVAYLLKQPWDKSINSAELTATDISRTMVLGRMNPIRWEELGNEYYFSLSRQLYTPEPAANTLSSYPAAFQLTLFDVFVPILLLALAVLTLTKERRAYFGMLWLAILFLYIEWGPYPRNLRQIFYYLPVSHWISPDNFLYVCIPLVLTIAAFLSTQLSSTNLKQAILISISSTLVASALLENPVTGVQATEFLAIIIVAIFCFCLIGAQTIFTFRTNRGAHRVIFIVLLAAIGMGSLKHGLHYHVSFFEAFSERRANLKAAHAYLQSEPAYPIVYGTSGLPGWLNIYSGYAYSPPLFTNPTYPETRFTENANMLDESGGFLLNTGCGPVTSLAEWPIKEFGDASSEFCVSLVKKIPVREVNAALAQAQASAADPTTAENILNYIAVAANAENFPAFVDGLSKMAAHDPSDTPIVQASEILVQKVAAGASHQIDLLPTDEGDLENWKLGSLLNASLADEQPGKVLVITINGSTPDLQTIQLPLTLRANTAYVLEIEFTSFAPANLVDFTEPEIPDSSGEIWTRELSWTTIRVAFVTPSSLSSPEQVWLELAKLYDKGSISFRRLILSEIQ